MFRLLAGRYNKRRRRRVFKEQLRHYLVIKMSGRRRSSWEGKQNKKKRLLNKQKNLIRLGKMIDIILLTFFFILILSCQKALGCFLFSDLNGNHLHMPKRKEREKKRWKFNGWNFQTRFRGGWIWLERARRWNFKKKKKPRKIKRGGVCWTCPPTASVVNTTHIRIFLLLFISKETTDFFSLCWCVGKIFLSTVFCPSASCLQQKIPPPPIVMEKKKKSFRHGFAFLTRSILNKRKMGRVVTNSILLLLKKIRVQKRQR